MTAALNIPDDLIPDIILRLPAAAVLRCRAVCKQWRDLVDDAGFLAAHHRRRPPTPLLCFRRDDPPDHVITPPRKFRVRLDAIDLRAGDTSTIFRFAAPARRDRWRRTPPGYVFSNPWDRHACELVKDHGAFAVHGSCDGILLVSYKSGTYLVNPARRRWSGTSSIGGEGFIGFYLHRPSGEFRVIHHPVSLYTGNDDFRIITLPPTGAIQRRINGGPGSGQLMGAVPIRKESPPALVAGNLHWLRHGDSDILVFDTVAETACLMQAPPAVVAGPEDGGHVAAQALLELDGKLTMTVTRGNVNVAVTSAELWVLRDYERDDSWVCEVTVPLTADEIVRLGGDGVGAVAVVSMDGDVVVQCAECVLQCDATGRVRRRYELENHRFVAVPDIMLKESLVPHAHADGREVSTGYEGIQFPPFFLDIYQDHSSASG